MIVIFFILGAGVVLCLETLFQMQTPQGWVFIWIIFGCETSPFKKQNKKWNHNGTGPHLSKCWQRITFRSLTMLHIVWNSFLCISEDECKICILDFRANGLSVWACLLHSWAITVRLMVARVGKGCAHGPGKNDWKRQCAGVIQHLRISLPPSVLSA